MGRLATIVVLLLAAAGAFPQDREKERAWYSVSAWRQPQGLPQNTVLAIRQTRDGYMWIGTKGGLARFDGVHFTIYDDRDRSQLAENEVWALDESQDGSLWIATLGGGLARLKDGRFTQHTTRDGLINDAVICMCRDTGDRIWAGTDTGLSRLENGRFTSFTTRDGLAHNRIRSLHCDPDGSVWIGTNDGHVHRYRDRRLLAVHEADRPGLQIRAMLRDREQTLWVGSSDGIIGLKEDGGTWRAAVTGLASQRVTRLHQDPQGNLWIGTFDGLYRYADGAFVSRVDVVPSVPTEYIGAIASDHEGSVWIGTRAQGLARLRRGEFLSYTTRDGLPSAEVSTVLEDGTGALWVGTIGGLSRLRAGRFTSSHEHQGMPARSVLSLAVDDDETLWVGTEAGLYRSPKARPCRDPDCRGPFARVGDASTKLYIRVIRTDPDGSIWIGTDYEGVAHIKDGKTTFYNTRDGLPHDAVRDLLRTPDGAWWIATRGGGISRLKNGRFTTLTEKDGLASNSTQGLHLDADGSLWVATRNGISRLKDGRFVNYTVNDGLYASFVYDFLDDGRGFFWLRCSKGIFRVAKKELDDFAAGKVQAVSSTGYGVEHGLSSTVGTTSHHPASFQSKDGRLWFSMSGGLSVVDPQGVATNPLPPPVHVEAVTIDHKVVDRNAPADAGPGRGDLEFRYAALSFLAPEKVRFKYRLEGYEEEWVDAGDRRAAFYSNIPPGRYTFRVMAANNDGVWNETGAAFSLRLRPHFYQTGWFYGLCGLAVLVAGLGLHQVRTRELRQRETELVRVVDERTRELRQYKEHLEEQVAERTVRINSQLREKEILLKEIHHRVKNNLQIVSSLLKLQAGAVEDPAARAAFHESEDRVRSMSMIHDRLYQADDMARIDLADYLRSLSAHLFRSYGVSQSRVRLRLDLDRVELGLDSAIPCGLLINELVSNALKHAFPDDKQGEVTVGLRAVDGHLVLRVADDGVGLPDDRDRRDGSLGLQLVHTLAEQLGGTLQQSGDPGTTFEVRFTEPQYKARLSG
jgi:two-component sensor histidine kinase/ligand-binding sensor domain-containing protein